MALHPHRHELRIILFLLVAPLLLLSCSTCVESRALMRALDNTILALFFFGDSTSYPGFDEASAGCYGTGLVEAAFLCNRKSYICGDASKYVFWDSIHPTERTYFLIFKALLPV